MSVQASPSRPATKSIGAAVVSIVLTLAILVVVFLSFLIAPLLVLALAYLAYAVLRPGNRRRATAATPPAAGSSGSTHAGAPHPRGGAAHGFGSGAGA